MSLLARDTIQRKIASQCHHNENSKLVREPDNGPIVVMNLSLWSLLELLEHGI